MISRYTQAGPSLELGRLFCVNSPLYKGAIATHSPAPMILAAIDWLSISINLLLVLFVIVCLLMTLLILMQRPKQEGLGAAFGGGVTDQVFGARTTNVLQRGTVYLGSMFFLLALVLAILIGHQNKDSALLQQDKPVAEQAEPKPDTEGADSTQTGTDPGELPSSLLDELPAEQSGPDDAAEQSAGTGEQKPESSELPETAPGNQLSGEEPTEGETSKQKP